MLGIFLKFDNKKIMSYYLISVQYLKKLKFYIQKTSLKSRGRIPATTFKI